MVVDASGAELVLVVSIIVVVGLGVFNERLGLLVVVRIGDDEVVVAGSLKVVVVGAVVEVVVGAVVLTDPADSLVTDALVFPTIAPYIKAMTKNAVAIKISISATLYPHRSDHSFIRVRMGYSLAAPGSRSHSAGLMAGIMSSGRSPGSRPSFVDHGSGSRMLVGS